MSIGFYNSWVDVNLVDVNPSNFLNIFKYSSCVFTSMFHGVLFSVKYNKTFWFTDDPYRKNKLKLGVQFSVFSLKLGIPCILIGLLILLGANEFLFWTAIVMIIYWMAISFSLCYRVIMANN